MKGLAAAFTAAIAAMRAELGFVPPGQQRIIVDQLAETRNDVHAPPLHPSLRAPAWVSVRVRVRVRVRVGESHLL